MIYIEPDVKKFIKDTAVTFDKPCPLGHGCSLPSQALF